MAQERVRSNPFYHSGPVTGDRFYDREEEMARLLGLLSTTPPTSVALHGPERIGKSSILRQLCEVAGPDELPDRKLIFLDMQRIFSVEDFVSRFLQKLGAKGEGYAAFEEAIYESDEPIVLCLDEFGKALADSDFDADFYDFLRSLTQTGRLALVISTLRPLKELKVPSGADVSRFFNVFRPFQLGPFPPEAARRLVDKGEFSEAEMDWVLQNAKEANHPYHLQLLASCLFETGSQRQALNAYLDDLAALEEPEQKGAPSAAPEATSLEIAAGISFIVAVSSVILLMVFSLQPILFWLMGLGLLFGLVFSVLSWIQRRRR